MAERFDLVRLAELRDAHADLVSLYRRSGEQVRDAAQRANRARADAPPLPGDAPAAPARAALAPGISPPPTASRVRPKTNEFYLQPLVVLRSFTTDQLTAAKVDTGALSRILAAETRLERLRTEHEAHAKSVRESANFMAGIDLFAQEQRL